jgi:very-short-patch-repair endonuclease
LKFITLKGKIVSVSIKKGKRPNKFKSKGEEIVYEWLLKNYKYNNIIYEWKIPHTRFTLDFFISDMLLSVEVDGNQHYKQNSLFHKNRLDFLKQKKRDAEKQDFCDLNQITLVRIADIYNIEIP